MDPNVEQVIEVRSRDLVGPHKRKIPIISALSRPTFAYGEGTNATEQTFQHFFCEVMKTEPKLLFASGYSRAFYSIESRDGGMTHSAIVVCGQD